MEMLEDPSLLNVGDGVGKDVRVDPNIVDMIRGRYARNCVVLNWDKSLMRTVVVWGEEILRRVRGVA